jgi:hypothetical protein
MEAGDKLSWIATVFEDGSGKGTLKSTKEFYDFNYCHIHKTTYGVTGRQANTKLYGGSDLALERKKQAIEHAKGIDKLYLWGAGGRSTQTGSGGHELTTMAGLEFFIQSNKWDLDGTRPTERAFVEALEDVMKWGEGGNLNGSGQKFFFGSSRWMTEIEFFGKEKVQYDPVGSKILGFSVREYQTTHGKLTLIPWHLLDEDARDRAYIIDANHVHPVVHEGRDTKIMKDIQANDVDGYEELIMTDLSLKVELEAAHAIFSGLDV